MKKFNTQNFSDAEFIEILEEFSGVDGVELTENIINEIIDENMPVILQKKNSQENWVFLNIPEVGEVVGMPLVEKVTKKDQMEIHSTFAKFDDTEEGLVYIGNELNMINFKTFRDTIKLKILADFFKTGQMLYTKVELKDFDYGTYNKVHETSDFEVLMTKDASATLFLLTKTTEANNSKDVTLSSVEGWLVPIFQDNNDEISLFFGIGNNSPIRKKIGKYPDTYDPNAAKIAAEMISVIENVRNEAPSTKQKASKDEVTQIDIVDESADDLVTVEKTLKAYLDLK